MPSTLLPSAIVLDISNPFFGMAVRGCEDSLFEGGYSLFLFPDAAAVRALRPDFAGLRALGNIRTGWAGDTIVQSGALTDENRRQVDEAGPSLPGQVQHTRESLLAEVRALSYRGVPAVILFGVPETKDATGSQAWDIRTSSS